MQDLSSGSGSSVSVAAATVTTVLARRTGKVRRIALSISNYGGNSVYIVFSDSMTADTGYGILLAANSTLQDSDGGGYLCWNGTVTAYSAAGSTLAVFERVLA